MTAEVLRTDVMEKEPKEFTLDDLCTLLAMNKRKVRFYIQKGLVDRPGGTGKGARYSQRHLEQLLTVRKWKDAGLSLERIQNLLESADEAARMERGLPPPRSRRPGAVEVWSHLHIADGVELHIEPQRSGLSPEQVRALCRAVMTQLEDIKSKEPGDDV